MSTDQLSNNKEKQKKPTNAVAADKPLLTEDEPASPVQAEVGSKNKAADAAASTGKGRGSPLQGVKGQNPAMVEPSLMIQVRDAYIEAIESWEVNPVLDRKELVTWAKKIADAGHAPEDVTYAVHHLKREPFWSKKHLTLSTVAKQLGAIKSARQGLPPEKDKARNAGRPTRIIDRIQEL